MRVTNSMINKSSMRNMNTNKISVDALNTQMTTQKKISRPSEDPVIAIRALRLRSQLSEINQFYSKNIPDAESWLELTSTALENMKTIVTDVYAQCVNGSNDTLNEEDRDAILQNLQALREQVYKEGNADNGGRTIFTGFKTSSQLTFEEDEGITYDITEKMSFQDIEEKRYYYNKVELPNNEEEVKQGVEKADMPQEITNFRMRLSYDGITGTDGSTNDWTDVTDATDIKLMMETEENGEKKSVPLTYTAADGTETQVNVRTRAYGEWQTQDQFAVDPDEVLFIPETGELIFGKNVSEGLKGAKAEFSVSYSKTGFKEGEIRPEHYFDCTKHTDTGSIDYKKENQEIAYTVSYNQTLVVNTQASDVFNASMGRDIDELTDTVKAAIAAHDKVKKLEEMKLQEQYSSPEMQELLGQWLEAAETEAAYMDDNMQKHYEKAVGDFQGYLNDISLAATDVGSKGDRLKLTKNRVSNQQTAVEKLKSTNEDRELSDIIIDYTAAYTAYQASLLASSKANQQTLLNYL